MITKTSFLQTILLSSISLLFFFNQALYSQTQIGQDIDGEAANDNSGTAVSLSADGQIVAIGAPGNDGIRRNSGHVRIYQYAAGIWTQMGSDIDGERSVDQFGASVSLSANGQIVAIGAFGNDGNGSASGHVRVFQFLAGAWTKVGNDIDGEAGVDNSGFSVSLSADGQIVAIGAINNDGNGINSGHVRVYQFSGGAWTQLGQDIDGETVDDQSGWSVSLSADGITVAIGAHRNDGNGANAGHVRIYRYTGGTWNKIGNDIDGEAAGDLSGRSVSLSADGQIVAIGAINNAGNGTHSGHVRIYQFSSGAWTQLGGDIDGEAAGDLSGRSVSLSADGQIVAIGATSNRDNGISAGHVRIFHLISGSWIQAGDDIDAEAAGDQYGRSVSISVDGKTVAIGAPRNEGNGSFSGHVRIYDIDEQPLVNQENIPTMSQWALFLFGLIVLTLGVIGVYNLQAHVRNV